LLDGLVKQHSVDKSRIYITGLSMGGYGTFDALARRPGFFTAAIPICGGGDMRTAPKIKHVPMWVFHGDADNVVPPQMSRAMVKAITAAGGKPKYTEYKRLRHNSWSATYANPEVWSWLFAQKKIASQ
jgi:predicted peptidase